MEENVFIIEYYNVILLWVNHEIPINNPNACFDTYMLMGLNDHIHCIFTKHWKRDLQYMVLIDFIL